MSADRSAPRKRGRNKSGRPASGDSRASRPKGAGATEWLYGVHPVREALRAGRRRLVRLWIREGARRPDHEALLTLADQAGVATEWVDRDRIDACAGPDAQTQGVALECGPLPEVGLVELIERSARAIADGEAPRIVALDGVEDPQNVGAIARVADSAGVAGIILTDRRAPPITPAVARASAGAVEWLPVARVANLSRALGELKQHGFWVVAAAEEGGSSLFEVEDRVLSGPTVVVLGAEGKGVRPGILQESDHRVWVPMQGGVASLNVSTAGAVILYDLMRRATTSAGK